MPEHPSDDYLLVNPGIKISRLNCAEGFRGAKRHEWEGLEEKTEREIKVDAHVQGVLPSVCLAFTIVAVWQCGDDGIAMQTGRQQTNHAPATNLLGSNSCRSAAYVKPPVYSASICICLEFSIEDSIPLGLTLGYSISYGLLHSFSCSYSARVALFFSLSRYPLPRCLNKTFLNWVSSEGDACPAFLGAAGFYFFNYLLTFLLCKKRIVY